MKRVFHRSTSVPVSGAGRRLALLFALAAAVVSLRGQTSQPPQTPPTFRASVDLIAVDLEVVDRAGHPMAGLAPEKFTVMIDGRRRRVVTAELIRYGSSAALLSAAAAGPGSTTGGLAAAAPTGRVIMLAVDCISFNIGVSRGIVTAAREFVRRLLPDDQIGLFAFPIGPRIEPSTDHTIVLRALDKIVGQREGPAANRFNLRPAELIDLSIWASGASAAAAPPLVTQLCGDPSESGYLECTAMLHNEIKAQSLYYEGQAHAALGMFRSLLQNLGSVPTRTTVVLMSAGTVASDIPGGRPDLGDFGNLIGKDATRSNLSVYTLFVDQSWLEQYAAETRRARNTLQDLTRDSAILGRWLDQFTGTAGGALIKVMFGNGEYAFDRVLSETSAYYLLGVEPTAADRDGRIHDIAVKVSERTATVRGRKWVVIPRPGAATSTRVAGNTAPPAAPAPAPVHVPSSLLAPVVDAFNRGEDDKVHRLIWEANDAGVLIREFRQSGGLWRDAPRRDSLFALEIGTAGLRSVSSNTRDEAIRLLVQYGALIRQPEGADAFECGWYLAEAAAMPALFQPAATLPFLQQGRLRCPSEPRLALAAALLSEQQFAPRPLPVLPGDPPAAQDSSWERDIAALYEVAARDPATAAEARVRAAYLYFRLNRLQRARELLDQVASPPAEVRVRYLLGLVRGQVLHAQGQPDTAIAAFRDAILALPGGTTARIALMSQLIMSGDRREAEDLATAVQADDVRPFDPWWSYWLGDIGEYQVRIARLRELAK